MNPERTVFAGRLIALSLLLGVLVYAGVAVWLLREGRVAPLEASTGRILLLGWGVAAVGCAVGWFVFRRRALDLLTSTRGLRDIHHGDAEGPGRALGLLIVAWAMAEAIGIGGVTVGLLTGRTGPLAAGPLATAIGVAATWPKDEWFAAFRPGRAPGKEGGESWE